VRGLGVLAGIEVLDVPGASAGFENDYVAQRDACLASLETQDFFMLHVEATDEAGHTKQPKLKRDVIESLDRACQLLIDVAVTTTFVITGDHATPATGGMMHSAHPTSLILVGPHVHSDEVATCGERTHKSGDLGAVRAKDILPLMSHFSHRASFKGHATGSCETIALPDNPVALDFSETANEKQVTQVNRTGIK
jgi:2,3-bisphosphoglycerate-independent phosphoglycerate mutase